MKFIVATSFLLALCALSFAQDEDIMVLEKVTPMNLINETGSGGDRPRSRIIGGRYSYLGLIPHQVALRIQFSGGNGLCGGSLIAPNWVVTAAHCAQGASSFQVRLGSLYYYQSGQTFYSTQAYVHPSYNSNTLQNDIALIRLPSNAAYNSYVQPIQIADAGLSFTSVRISGWGRMASGSVSDTLIYADVVNYDINQCARYYGSSVLTGTVCTVSSNGESPCNGDSGGPLVDNSSKKLVGVISFVSSRGCTLNYPAGYVKVGAYRNWLRSVTGISNL